MKIILCVILILGGFTTLFFWCSQQCDTNQNNGTDSGESNDK